MSTMKTILYLLCISMLSSCAEDDSGDVVLVSAEEPPSYLPLFDSAFFAIPDKPQESVTYFAPDTINVAHRIVYHYNQTGDIAEEINFFERDNRYSTLRYWYSDGNLVLQKFKENPWYTQYMYNSQNLLQYRIHIDLRAEVPDTTSIETFYYFDGGNTVVRTDLPDVEYDQLPEGSYFYDSLLYKNGLLIEEHRKYINSVDGVFHL